MKAYYHLPGLFEFYELYKHFLGIYKEHREYFYDWCQIGSIYGAPTDCLWAGGRVEVGDVDSKAVVALMKEYGISARLTLSNSLLREEHFSDKSCNNLCELFSRDNEVRNGVIIHSDLLMDYLKERYPNFYYVSTTTKVLTDYEEFLEELRREEFQYVVPDFRINKKLEKLNLLLPEEKNKVEFLCNECCWIGCTDRKSCYEEVSRKNLGEGESRHICHAPNSDEGYRFSKAMENPAFISLDDIRNTYIPMGFSNFKIEGRGLGSAMILEFLLYYMIKPEFHIHVREEVYLDNSLDLF